MNLRDLVGKLAIRTARPDVTVDLHDLMNPLRIGAFCVGSEPWRKANGYDEQYMDTPVKIVSVKEEQVVVENTKDGRRKLLERKYMDDHWTDYERLLNPEEEEKEKAEKLIANAKREVEESLIKSLEQNLKENLAKDTIERMNIPEVLKKLSSIGAKQVTGTSLPE